MEKLTIRTTVVGPVFSNAYLVSRQGSGDAVLIDAGDDAMQILKGAQAEGLNIRAVLLTHGHFDHILAAREIRERTGAEIYIHAQDADYLADPNKNGLGLILRKRAYEPFSADHLLSDGERIDRFGLRIEVIHVPGHTPGCVAYFFEEDGALFTGDTLFADGYGRTDLPGGDARALRNSLERLYRMDGNATIYPGHGHSEALSRVGRSAP